MARYAYIDPAFRRSRPFISTRGKLVGSNDNSPTRLVGAGNVEGTVRSLANLRDCLDEAQRHVDGSILKDAPGHYVYIIAPLSGAHAKVGKAKNPIARLASLQTGNPEKLFIHRACCFYQSGFVDRVEYWAHDLLKAKYPRLEGEWFKCSPEQAHDALLEASDETRGSYTLYTPIVLREAENGGLTHPVRGEE